MSAEENGPRIERDGGRIKLYSNENTYIIIDKDTITIKGTVIIDGILDIKTGVGGGACGTSVSITKNGVYSGVN